MNNPQRRVTVLRIFGALIVMALLAVLISWIARKPIAESALHNALESRGVRASYTVKDIGLRWQRIENLRLGDPKKPDLTADWVEVQISTGIGSIAVTELRAGGVRLRGRIVDGRLTLGEIDKLLPKGDAKTPFTLPEIIVDVVDARMRIDSSNGGAGGVSPASATRGSVISMTRISMNTADISSIGMSTMKTFISGLSSRSQFTIWRKDRRRPGRFRIG